MIEPELLAQIRMAAHHGNTDGLDGQQHRAVLLAEVDLLQAVLWELVDEQNDAPLEKRRAQWAAAMAKARSALQGA